MEVVRPEHEEDGRWLHRFLSGRPWVNPLGGAAPFGFRWENRKLVPDQEEAPVRRLIYELFAEKKRLRTVARVLNDRGFRTRGGSKFTDTTVKRLIRDPTAKGRRRANYTRSLGDKKHWTLKPESEWVWTGIPALVSEELWDACNRLLDERKRPERARVPKRAAHVFSGYVFCSCGKKMYVLTGSSRYGCEKCRRKIPEADLERIFQEELKGFFCKPERIALHLAMGDRALEEKTRLLSSLRTEEEKTKKEMERLYRLYMGDHISAEGFGGLYRPLEERAQQLSNEIPRLQAEADFLRIRLVSDEDLVRASEDLYSGWSDLPFEERRAIVEALLDRITIEEEEVTFDLLFLPSPLEKPTNEQRIPEGSARPRLRVTTARFLVPPRSARSSH